MSGYDAVIIATLAGFLLLAYLLLAPVYRFLKREERASRDWTPEALARRAYDAKPENGSPKDDDPAVLE